LPEFDDAERWAKATESQFTVVAPVFQRLQSGPGVGLALLHRHHTLSDSELIIKHQTDDYAWTLDPTIPQDSDWLVPYLWRTEKDHLVPLEFLDLRTFQPRLASQILERVWVIIHNTTWVSELSTALRQKGWEHALGVTITYPFMTQSDQFHSFTYEHSKTKSRTTILRLFLDSVVRSEAQEKEILELKANPTTKTVWYFRQTPTGDWDVVPSLWCGACHNCHQCHQCTESPQ